MKCPIDGNPLERRPYEAALSVEQCAKCKGMFLEQGELEAIQETVENDYSGEYDRFEDHAGRAYAMARQEGRGTIECPSCGSSMNGRDYGFGSQVRIDQCPSCGGVWLDEGEMKALEVFFEMAQLETGRMRRNFFRSLVDLFRLRG